LGSGPSEGTVVVQFLENGVRHTIPEDDHPLFQKAMQYVYRSTGSTLIQQVLLHVCSLGGRYKKKKFEMQQLQLALVEDWIVKGTSQGGLLGPLGWEILRCPKFGVSYSS